MITLDAKTARHGEVTLVQATVTNTLGTPQQVTLESQTETTWPPRVRGSVRPEWTDGRWEGRLEAGQRRALGFATPEMIAVGEEPLTVGSARRAPDGQETAAVERSRILGSLEAWEPSSATLSRRSE